MALITLRSGKGSPLTHVEMDANFQNLNTDKLDAPINSGRRVVDASLPLDIRGALIDGDLEIGKLYKKTVVLNSTQIRSIAQSPTAVSFIEAPILGKSIIVHQVTASALPGTIPFAPSPVPLRLVYERSSDAIDVLSFAVKYSEGDLVQQRTVRSASPTVVADGDDLVEAALAYDFFLAEVDKGVPSDISIVSGGTGFIVGQELEFTGFSSTSSYAGTYGFKIVVTAVGSGGAITDALFLYDTVNADNNFAAIAEYTHTASGVVVSVDDVFLSDTSVKITAWYSFADVLSEQAITTTTTSTTTAAPTTTTTSTTTAAPTTTTTTTFSGFPPWPIIPTSGIVSDEIEGWSAGSSSLIFLTDESFPAWPDVSSAAELAEELENFSASTMTLNTLTE